MIRFFRCLKLRCFEFLSTSYVVVFSGLVEIDKNDSTCSQLISLAEMSASGTSQRSRAIYGIRSVSIIH